MLSATAAWVLGSLTIAVTIAATILNGIFACGPASSTASYAIQYLLCIAFAFNIISVAYAFFFIHVSIRKINKRAYEWSKPFKWRVLVIGAMFATVALVLSALVLIWLVIQRKVLSKSLTQPSTGTLLVVWFALWGSSIMLQVALYSHVGLWTRHASRTAAADTLDLDFGIRVPPTEQIRPATSRTHQSSYSQDPTLASPPRTPNRPGSSPRHSSSTRVGPGSSRTRLVGKHSANSSFEFPACEVKSADSAFDLWDTSSVHREMRAALLQSPPVTRSGLETIPGSRPDTPEDALDGPFLPESPLATTSDKVAALTWISSSPLEKASSSSNANSTHRAVTVDGSPRSAMATASSPPSSPPNFSRPTSRSQNRPAMTDAPMHELIHPLFRPDSARPPPIATFGSMVTASPLAGQPITPRSLARMRSATVPQHWNAMPSPDRVSNPPSTPGSPGLGSPGPSIADEETLPPILPGFVLSAGKRSSFVGYGKRKSVKERPKSAISTNAGEP